MYKLRECSFAALEWRSNWATVKLWEHISQGRLWTDLSCTPTLVDTEDWGYFADVVRSITSDSVIKTLSVKRGGPLTGSAPLIYSGNNPHHPQK